MSKPYNRLWFPALALSVLAVIFSCSQPDDVLTPVSRTVLNLAVERLPTPPVGMVYELWVSEEVVQGYDLDPETILSLGKFSFMTSDTLIAFLEPVDTMEIVRADSNQFVIEGDLFAYRSVFVSVEHVDDLDPDVPGPIMLVGNVIPLGDFTPTLNFPISDELWESTVQYNLEAVSDNRSNVNDSRGIWFCSYRTTLDTIPDTLNLDTITYPWIVTVIQPVIEDGETLNKDSLYAVRPFTVRDIQVVTEKVLYGPDTLILNVDSFMHTHVTFVLESLADSTPPFTKRDLDAGAFQVTAPGDASRVVRYDIFTQGEEGYGLPGFAQWGWKYKGWAVSPYIPTAGTGEFTPPAWPYNTPERTWIPGAEGGLVTTGTFTRIDTIDDNDPFTLDSLAGDLRVVDTLGETTLVTIYKRPYYPGEDFLNSASLLARYGLTEVELMPEAANGSIEGTVFISLEPDNGLTDSTNFPLIAFIGEVPPFYTVSGLARDPVVVTMVGKYGTVPGTNQGFPEIKVRFKRQ
ncbi:MAG TPA: hypothetical protein VMY05_04310 [Acidobacteriota bacterium]|nr:hypothetical protein [Acidobacteriota bacterium]